MLQSFNLAGTAAFNVGDPLHPDAIWFRNRRDRRILIRKARDGEFANDFMQLGDHNNDRRRVLVWRVTGHQGVPEGTCLPIPFLAGSDETFTDDDKTGLRVLQSIMGSRK